ncbi:efflux RND transporter periplasmic adaptor subunit [Helicobacter equorum]|uniref:efflux RND transporter periplasmic adaptor subunit n=1 Tax=Helicobacter equorum TaxID=361872 RepID=UPI000CF120CF|nr:efflux RND transporter periplasmic adaptor subunit [Helicobacter equorum]
MNIYDTLNPKKRYLNRVWITSISIVCLIIFGVIVYFWKFHTPSIHYETITPAQGPIQSSVSAQGSLSPTNEVEIGSVISGIVLEVFVEENDRVQKGEVLARINPESINQEIARYKAQLNSAKAQLKASEQTLIDKKWNYDRLLDVYESTGGKAPSQLELQNAKTAYTSAKSDVDIKKASIVEIETSIQSASIDLKNSNIVTPIDGVILTKSVEVGQSVAASFQAPVLFKVAEKLEEMVLKANISEADIGKIQEGQEVHFSVDAYPNKRFKAKVNKVNFGSGDGSTSSNSSSSSSSSSNSSSEIVSYIARIEVDNKDLLLRPNMSAIADIIIAKADNALLVPSSVLYFDLNKALQKATPAKSQSIGSFFTPPRPPKQQIQSTLQTKKSTTLWVLKNNIPEAVNVEVGISDGQYTQILSGIDAQSIIITAIKAN